MTLSRLLAYPYVAFMALSVIVLSWALAWAVAFGGRVGDWKAIAAALGFITLWSWAGTRVYVRHIKKPREERKRQRAEALAYVEKTIAPESSLSAAIEVLRKNLSLVGEPRHRPSSDPSFDAIVEIEAHGFIISLFGRHGVIKTWSIR
jgi:hypothetical protein